MARRLLWGSLVLAPITFVAHYVFDADDTLLFLLASAALIPLAWLIGEATEHAAEHTGPGIGGFLNASFGNAPELIIALFAISNSLPNVVRGSLAGSVVSNILLVLGLAMLVGPDHSRLDRRSLVLQLGLVFFAVLLFVIPSVPGFHGDPDRHSLAIVMLPVAVVLLPVYIAVTFWNLRQHRAAHKEEAAEHAWSLPRSLVALASATAVTALISEILVHSLDGFAHAAGLSEFFISFVIVAIVGNAAEHGGAVVVAYRGKIKLAAEIALASSAIHHKRGASTRNDARYPLLYNAPRLPRSRSTRSRTLVLNICIRMPVKALRSSGSVNLLAIASAVMTPGTSWDPK